MSFARLRSLWNEDGLFHSFQYNALATKFNAAQLITTVVLLGFFHSQLTFYFYWWPVIEGIRVFSLTVARCDVMLKIDEDSLATTGPSACTRHSLVIINLLGLVWLCVGVPIYIYFLPGLFHTTVAWIFSGLAVVIFVVRFALSLPLIAILCGSSNEYGNYERIDDGPFRDSVSSESNPFNSAQQQEQFGSIQANGLSQEEIASIRSALAHEDMAEQDFARAIAESRKESYQSLREQQDEDYRRTLDEHLRASIADSEYSAVHSSTRGVSFAYMEDELPQKEPTPPPPFSLIMEDEPPASDDSVVARIRLPNGERVERRFLKDGTIGDVMEWIRIELWKNDLRDMVETFRLVSTMPRVQYDDRSSTMEQLQFWRHGSTRESITPMLYVEELL